MNTAIWLRSWIREAREDLKPCFLFFFYFLPSPLFLLMPLFRDASVLTSEVKGRSSTWAIPLLHPNALSLWFAPHTGPCHNPPTHPSLTVACEYAELHLKCTFIAVRQLRTSPSLLPWCFTDCYLVYSLQGYHKIRRHISNDFLYFYNI